MANCFIAEKNLAWRIRMPMCVYDCTRRGFTSSYICGQCFSLQHAAIPRFSSLSSHFPIAFLSPCSLTHSFPQYRGLSKPVHVKRFIPMTLRQWNREYRKYRGLNKRFHNLTVFINDLSSLPPVLSTSSAPVFLSLTLDERCSISVPSRSNSQMAPQLSLIYLSFIFNTCFFISRPRVNKLK